MQQKERPDLASHRSFNKGIKGRMTTHADSIAYTAATSEKSFNEISASQFMRGTRSNKRNSSKSKHKPQMSLIDIRNSVLKEQSQSNLNENHDSDFNG